MYFLDIFFPGVESFVVSIRFLLIGSDPGSEAAQISHFFSALQGQDVRSLQQMDDKARDN